MGNIMISDALSGLKTLPSESVDSLPSSAILFIDVGSAFVLVILPPCLCPVFLAKLPVTQVRTAGVGTRSLGFSWHCSTSFRA